MSETLEKKARAPKRKTETYFVGGTMVEMRQVDPDKRDAADGDIMHGPAQRSKWEIWVDGVHRGYAFYPNGVANPWEVTTLEPQDLWTGYDGWDTVAWGEPDGEHGGWAARRWDGLMGILTKIKPLDDEAKRGKPIDSEEYRPYEDYYFQWRTREQIAQHFVDFVREGRAPTREEVLERFVEAKQARAERAEQARLDKARRERESEERRAALAQAAEEAEQRRREILEGLESIRDRLRAELKNQEADALVQAIIKFGGDPNG